MKEKLPLEGKVLIFFFMFVVIGFALINSISILFVKKLLENQFYEKVKIYKSYYYPETELPEFIKLSKKEKIEGYIHLGKKDRLNIHIKESVYESIVKTPLYTFAKLLFIWEAVLIVIFSALFYKLLYISIKKEQETKRFFEMFTLAFTHKLGNLLSTQKVNIEILKKKYKDKAVDRLKNSYDVLEEEFKSAINLIKNIYLQKTDAEEVDVSKLVVDVVNQYKKIYPNKKVFLSLSKSKAKAKKAELQIAISILIENAIKYGDEIKIKVCKNKVFISNKIDNTQTKGTGIGLELVKYLSKKNHWELKIKAKNRFIVYLST